MFNKKKENKMVWLVIEKTSYSAGNERFSVAKKAYSLADAVGFKEIIKLHNKSVEDGSYYERHPEIKRPEAK